MREYWDNPVQTQASFCKLMDEEGIEKKFYRTGDFVRRTERNDLVLVGRKDRQIKLRGYRIELDEIELALVNTPEVSEAVAIVTNDEIQAFVTGGTESTLADARLQVEAVLPQYAHPCRIVWLEEMPRTSTGKIDRAKLTGMANAQRAA